MRFGQGATFGGAPELPWRRVAVTDASASQTTGLAALPTDQAGGEIRAIVNAALNNAGEVVSAGYLLFPLTDTRGRAVLSPRGILETRWSTITTPANASFIYAWAGLCIETTTAALNATPRYQVAGSNWQPAANPRGILMARTGALVPQVIGTGNAHNSVYSTLPTVTAAGLMSHHDCNLLQARAYALSGSQALQLAMAATPVTCRLILAFGTYGGAEPGGAVGARTVGGTLEYRFHSVSEDMY